MAASGEVRAGVPDGPVPLGPEERGLAEARSLVEDQLRAAVRLAGVRAVLAGDGAGAGAGDGATTVAGAADDQTAGWAVHDDGTVTVDPAYFLAAGDSPREAAYAVLVELWGVVRESRLRPRTAARRRALVAANAALAPLLAGTARGAAVWELAAALPGLSEIGEVRAARTIAAAGPLPRHLQFVAELSRAAFSRRGVHARDEQRDQVDAELDAAVAAELSALRNYGGAGDAIAALLAPLAHTDSATSHNDRLDRQLAVFGPPYFRLLMLDAELRGLHGGTSRPVGAEDDASSSAPDDLAPGHGGAEAQRADPAAEAADDAPSVAVDADQSPESGDDEQAAAEQTGPPPNDLFQLEREGFVKTVLDSPLSADTALVELLLEQAEREREADERGHRDPVGDRGRDALLRTHTGFGLAAHERYAERVRAWEAPIERTREIWRQVIDERITLRRALGRRAHPDGEVLSPWALARAVIDAHAGVAKPAAFSRYEPRVRVGREAGSTDYAFVIDRSGSMQGRSAQAAADAVLVLLEALAGAARDIREAEARIDRELDLELRTALFVYDAEPVCVKPLSAGLDDATRVRLDAEIRAVGGSTNDAAALDAVGRAFSDPARRRIAIVVSDGGTNDDTAAYRALARLRASGVTVWGIGVGSDVVVARYAPLSRRVDHPDQLVPALQDLIEELL